tara:strand:- start:705 stop:1010 length:306 start_codon:yes stop_codon:yes gene_type:complete
MIKIKYLDKSGKLKIINAKKGDSLLEISKKYNLDLEGACGGEMICSTCHVYIISKHLNILDKQSKEEKEILLLANNLKKNSRLACQIKISEKLENLVFKIA